MSGTNVLSSERASMSSMGVIPMDVLQMNLKHSVKIVSYQKTSGFALVLLCHRGSHWLLSPSRWVFNVLFSREEPLGSIIQVHILDLGKLRSRAKHKPKQRESCSSLEHFVAAMLLPAACFMACVGTVCIMSAMAFSDVLREIYGVAQRAKENLENRESILYTGKQIEHLGQIHHSQILSMIIPSMGPSHVHLLEKSLFKNTKVISCREIDSEEGLQRVITRVLDGGEYRFSLLPMELRKGGRRKAEKHCIALLFDRERRKVLLVDEREKRLQDHRQLVLDFSGGRPWKGEDVHRMVRKELKSRGWQYKRKDDKGKDRDSVLFRLPGCKENADRCRCPQWVIAAVLAYERKGREQALKQLQHCKDPFKFIKEYSSNIPPDERFRATDANTYQTSNSELRGSEIDSDSDPWDATESSFLRRPAGSNTEVEHLRSNPLADRSRVAYELPSG